MASISKRPDGRWRARYRDPDGREHAKHFSRKIDGERWLVEQQGKIARGEYVDPNAGRQTLASYAEQWVAAQVHRPSTAAVIEVDLRRHILPAFGHRQLASVRPSEVQAWVRGRSEVLAPATVERAYRCLASIFTSAVRDRLHRAQPVPGHPAAEGDPQAGGAAEHRAARTTAEQIIPDRYRALVVLAAGTGLRQGDAFGVTLDEIDWLRQAGPAPPPRVRRARHRRARGSTQGHGQAAPGRHARAGLHSHGAQDHPQDLTGRSPADNDPHGQGGDDGKHQQAS